MVEMKPIFRDERGQPGLPCPDKVSVPEMPHTSVSVGDHITTNKVWVGFRHFVYGFSIAATASLVAGAHPYLAVGLGVAGGVAEATRKTVKDANEAAGQDWPDILDKVLKIIVAIVEALKARKGGTK